MSDSGLIGATGSLAAAAGRRGIAARSKRGTIGETWWSQRFIALLESFGVGSRLQRGRNYARRGQVVELDVEPGIVIAKVQGSRSTPYRVRIRCKELSEQQWRRLEKTMASQAMPLAQLLAGEMPRDIEDVFASCKLTLFPRSRAELKASCTCPDWRTRASTLPSTTTSSPALRPGPFQIFAWRGPSRTSCSSTCARNGGAGSATRFEPRREAAPQPTLLADQLDSFWSNGTALAELHVSPLAAEAPDYLLRQLGPRTPLDVGSQNLIEILAPAYALMAGAQRQRALA